MNVVIMGAGRLAKYLAKTRLDKGHKINIIESDFTTAERLASEREDLRVIHGDGTDIRLLKRAHLADADCYIALSGLDEDNLIGCQIARQVFRVRRTGARVNNPMNRAMYERIGVDWIYSSTDIMVDLIEQDIDFEGMRVLYSVTDSPENIVEFVLSKQSDAIGRTLIDYDFPGNARVVLITRADGKSVIPVGSTVMEANDRMLVVCREDDYAELYE